MEASFKKYTDTSRIISLLVHGVIVLGMAVVWVIFGILHTPFYFVGAKGSGSSTAETIASLAANGTPFYLHLELGVVALTLVLASCYGFFKALKSFKTQRDAEVVSAFTVLIAEGWLAAIFFLSQGLFLFDLLGISGAALDLADLLFPALGRDSFDAVYYLLSPPLGIELIVDLLFSLISYVDNYRRNDKTDNNDYGKPENDRAKLAVILENICHENV